MATLPLSQTPSKLRVLICGDRSWSDYATIYQALRDLKDQIEIVIDGKGRGADTLGNKAARSLGLPFIRHQADWNQYGVAAGPIRNRAMLKIEKPNLVLAFSSRSHQKQGHQSVII